MWTIRRAQKTQARVDGLKNAMKSNREESERKGDKGMKRKTHIGMRCALLAAGFTCSASFTPQLAMAASPPFAYTDEKWASLKDDKLEFDEIADLVHEYNSTVIKNQIEYKDYQGKDRDEISQTYYDAADEIYENLNFPDSDDENYGSRLASAQSSELSADQMMEKGDKNVSDGDIIKWGYDKTEKSLVQSAQNQMISYWNAAIQLENSKNTSEQALASYAAGERKAAAGATTQSQVLSAQEAVLNAEAAIASAESSIAKTKESLCLMLGWNYNDAVEIGALPEPELYKSSAINLDEDIEKALSSNYDLKILERQVKNAMVGYLQREYEETLKSSRQAVKANVKSAYQNLLLAENKYAQSLKSLELEASTLQSAERKRAAGTLSQTAYESEIHSYETAKYEKDTIALSLLSAQLAYQWAVDGLAGIA